MSGTHVDKDLATGRHLVKVLVCRMALIKDVSYL